MIKNHSKKDFYLSISYDGLSIYLANNLYPDLAEFEIKLRSIAYSTLINDLGYDWVNESFPHIYTTNLKLKKTEGKEESKKEKEYLKLIQNVLEELRNVINMELSIASAASINHVGESIKSQIPKSTKESLIVPMNDHFSNITKPVFKYNSVIGQLSEAQS